MKKPNYGKDYRLTWFYMVQQSVGVAKNVMLAHSISNQQDSPCRLKWFLDSSFQDESVAHESDQFGFIEAINGK